MHATRIVAVRHGETAWNVDNRIQGQRDTPLNDRGLGQARRLARALQAHGPFAAIYSSDLQRTMDTARPIALDHRLEVIAEPGLRERAFGQFEGLTFAELEARAPEETQRWRQRDPQWAPPGGGENLLMVRERISQVVDRLAAGHAGEQIVLVTHGGILDALYRLAARLDIREPRTWQLANAGINRLLWTPEGLSIVGWSDTAHLSDAWSDEATA